MITARPAAPDDGRPIVVVGGGIIGVCVAHSLASRGAPVVLLERDEIGLGASFGNAGTVSPGHPPINGPGRWRELVRSIADPLSPLYISPGFTPGLARWLWSFARHCTTAHVEHCRRTMEPWSRVTTDLHDALAGEADAGLGYTRSGYVELYRTARGREAAVEDASFSTGQGLGVRELTAGELRERDPSLGAQVIGGFHHAAGRTMDPHRFVLHVAALAARAGAVVRTHAPVRRIVHGARGVEAVVTDGGETVTASAVVLATGAYSPELYRQLGCPLPVQPAKGYHVDLGTGEADSPRMSGDAYLFVERAVFSTPMPGRLRLAGTLEFSGENHRIRRSRLEQLTRGAREYLPDLQVDDVRSEWCGLRPCTPDGLPAVGPLPGCRGVFAATGHAMLGLTFGPATGEALAELILGGRSSPHLAGLDPGRFR